MFNILFGRCQKFEVNPSESTHKVHYLGNVLTGLLKGAHRSDCLKQCSGSSGAAKTKPTYKDKSAESLALSPNASKCVDAADDDQAELDVFHMQMRERHQSQVTDKSIVESVEKSVRLIWQNHVNNNGRGGIKMRLTITQGGLKAMTKSHGLTEYYGHRIHYVQAHPLHPKLFVWIYQHVGKSLKSEIRFVLNRPGGLASACTHIDA
jgi:hypothetical protein